MRGSAQKARMMMYRLMDASWSGVVASFRYLRKDERLESSGLHEMSATPGE